MFAGCTQFDADEKIWRGPPVDLQHLDKHKNVGEILLQVLADSDPEQVMQINGDTGEALTKGEVRQRTIRCAQHLTKLGCTQNERIAIVARNHHNLTPLLFAAFSIGAPIAPLDVEIGKDGIAHILARVRPLFIFCDSDILDTVNKIVTDNGLGAQLFTVNENVDGFKSIDSLMTGTGNEHDFVCTKLADAYSHIAIIACSSGSTGLPKSIGLTHALLNYVFCMPKKQYSFVSLCFSSLYWFSGVWIVMHSAYKNPRVFTSRPFSEDLFFNLVEKHKVQFFAGPVCQLQAALKSERVQTADLSSLVSCILIGSTIPTVLIESASKLIPKCFLITGYAMTEVVSGVAFTAPMDLIEHPTSVGLLVPGVQVKVINEKTGERCGIGEEGELFAKSPIRSVGYYNDEKATNDAFDDEQFFKTGDLGFFHESGRLHIIGRKKEIFKNRGFAVWPTEVEDVILKHRAVKSACVVSVYDGEIMSDLPAAVVIKKDSDSITADEVGALVADQLVKYKHLEGGVYFVNEFPMTPSGKIIKLQVKEIAQKSYEARKQKLKL